MRVWGEFVDTPVNFFKVVPDRQFARCHCSCAM